MKFPLLKLAPNRVRRNYRGGLLLDQLENQPHCADGNLPEDWLASTTEAINAGMPPLPNEGIGRVLVAGKTLFLRDLFREHGEYYLGRSRTQNLGFLAKLLDSGMRLQTQAHPTAAFAKERMGSPWGKLECYVIMGIRPGFPGEIRMGFQNAPSRDEWREIIETQDFTRMDACFEPVSVRKGDVWFVPGGLVHALGGGLLLLEVMEPSDLVVRCEFQRDGAEVPPGARYMGRDLEFCLDVFDYSSRSVEDIRAQCLLQPVPISESGAHSEHFLLPGSRTGCFAVRRITVRKPFLWPQGDSARLIVVVEGQGILACGGELLPADFGSSFLAAASSGPITIEPLGPDPLILCICETTGFEA